MIKAVFFDLDDTLLWDQKSVKESFVATCKIAEERYGLDPNQLEEAVREAAKKLYSSLGFNVFGTEKKGLKLENNIYFDVDFMILFL